ncbi:hypothetical protein [Chryseobacterium taklimakanense]|uniref:hypothetical protein n=1 Tax=Chryseobacterium taklimakanense TaxID=536441 RepID=UPI003743F88B
MEALKERETLSELASRYEVPPAADPELEEGVFKQIRAGLCLGKEKRTLCRQVGEALSENRTAPD